jgi:hypothetical protein
MKKTTEAAPSAGRWRETSTRSAALKGSLAFYALAERALFRDPSVVPKEIGTWP